MEIKDVESLAELAKIELTQEEKEQILKDMEGILDYVKVIEKVEVESIEEDNAIYNVWREDENDSPEFSKEIIVQQFPNSMDNFLKVKKIL